MKANPDSVLKSVPLSASTVKRRIDKMAINVENTLVSELQSSKFSLQLDESTFGSSCVLMTYVRYFSQSLKRVIDEFLFAKYLEGDSKGKTIFRCLKEHLDEHDISLENITAIATDGAPAMVGRYKGFVSLLKQHVPNVLTIHCVLYRNHLVAKKLSGELHQALMICVKAINKIKAHPLNSRLFAKLCEENDETANQLLRHTEVRWLSRGESLQQFVDIFDSTVEFLREVDPTLCDELKNCEKHLLYLADIYCKFNEIEKRLQGKDVTIIQARTVLMGFQVKLGLFENSLERRDFKYFKNLMDFSLNTRQNISDDDIEIFTNHLRKLQDDFLARFEDFENMKIPAWIVTLFDVKFENLNMKPELEYELSELSVDIAVKTVFEVKSFGDFWYNKNISIKYPNLTAAASFSHANAILSKQRNHLNLEERGDLRLKLTNIQPDINALIYDHKVHPSH